MFLEWPWGIVKRYQIIYADDLMNWLNVILIIGTFECDEVKYK